MCLYTSHRWRTVTTRAALSKAVQTNATLNPAQQSLRRAPNALLAEIHKRMRIGVTTR